MKLSELFNQYERALHALDGDGWGVREDYESKKEAFLKALDELESARSPLGQPNDPRPPFHHEQRCPSCAPVLIGRATKIRG